MATLSIALPHKIRRDFADLFATLRLLAAADKIEKAEQATIRHARGSAASVQSPVPASSHKPSF